MTTVGFGDITPAGDMERIFAIFGMLMGVSFYSYIIASVSSMVSSVDSKNAVYFEKMDQLASWMEHYDIEPALKRRVRRFFKQYYTYHSAIEDEYIMEKLSPPLQEAISIYLLHDFILEHQLFTDLPEGSLWKVMLIVRSCTFDAGARVVEAGDANVSMFIFKSGAAARDFEDDQKSPDEDLDEGDSFGELCLLGCSNESDITVKCEAKSDFFYIRRDAFLDAFSSLPEVRPSPLAPPPSCLTAGPLRAGLLQDVREAVPLPGQGYSPARRPRAESQAPLLGAPAHGPAEYGERHTLTRRRASAFLSRPASRKKAHYSKILRNRLRLKRRRLISRGRCETRHLSPRGAPR